MLRVKAGNRFPLLMMGAITWRYPMVPLHISWEGRCAVCITMRWTRSCFAIKQEMATFCTGRVLSEKAGLNLQAFLMRQKQETRIPFPCHLSTKETSCLMMASTQTAGPGCNICNLGLPLPQARRG
jgi:hypothetical protein